MEGVAVLGAEAPPQRQPQRQVREAQRLRQRQVVPRGAVVALAPGRGRRHCRDTSTSRMCLGLVGSSGSGGGSGGGGFAVGVGVEVRVEVAALMLPRAGETGGTGARWRTCRRVP